MVANALDIRPLSLADQTVDSGWSEDAEILRKCFGDALSSLLGPRLHNALSELASAYQEAAGEDWDSYGARAASEISLSHAATFLAALPMTIPLPEASVDPDGEVSFTWQRAPRWVFSISFSEDGLLNYAGLFGRNKTHGAEEFIGVVPKTVTDNLERLYSAEEP